MNKKQRYEYACSECGGEVSKPATGTGGEKKSVKAGLGGWKCVGLCRKAGIVVTRKML